MATEKRLLYLDEAIAKVKDDGVLGAGYDDAEREDDVIDMLESCHIVDAVEIDIIEDWLIAMANEYFGSAFCRVCCDIADRLDNLRTFAKERRTDGN